MQEAVFKVYIGKRHIHPGTDKRVTITVAKVVGSKIVEEEELTPKASENVVKHSQHGFEWGYRGNGPTQLALAILLDFTKDEKQALRFFEDFKDCFLTTTKKEGFQINGSEIEEFIKRKTAM